MSPRLNACHACTARKRRCDKVQPVCGRCREHELPCSYSSRKKRRFQPQGHELHQTPSESDDSLQQTLIASDTGLEGWMRGFFDNSGSQVPATGLTLQDHIQAASSTTLASELSAHPNSTESSQTHNSTQPTLATGPHTWFLTPDSWAIAHLEVTAPAFSSSVYSRFSSGLHDWFSLWLTQGHTPFLHRQLYADAVVPQSIRDAYASVAVHATKTSASEAFVEQILDANLSTLLTSQPTDDTWLSTRGHLARTQALFIHLVLALFSSSIPRRANAEQHVHTLLRWVNKLWKAATADPNLCRLTSHPSCEDVAVDAAFDGDPAPRLWRTWVLAESVRRIWLLATMTVSNYHVMKQQWSECSGGVHFTARASLWAAESAAAWMEASEGDQLFLLSLHGDRLFTTATWNEVDEMARHMFTAIWGLERVESWKARTARAEAARMVHG